MTEDTSDRSLDVDVSEVRELRQFQYAPTDRPFAETALDRYERKEFAEGDVAERFHEATKLEKRDVFAARSASRFVGDDSLRYAQALLEPDYPDAPRIDLPDPSPLNASLGEVLSERRSRRSYDGRATTVRELGTLLGHGLGATEEQSVDGETTKSFRAYPSGGALYPVEFYLAVTEPSERLDRGLYYYAPDRHDLRELRSDDGDFLSDARSVFDVGDASVDVDETAAVLFLTGAFYRSKAKYGPVGYRFVLQEAGHAAQNVQLVATAMGLGTFPNANYDDRAADDFLGVDGVDESTVYTVPIGHITQPTDD